MNDQANETNTSTPPPGDAPAIPEVDAALQQRFRLRRDIAPNTPTQEDSPTT
ncbi:hypothetical protein [Burkholderia pseudomallei]|uniref:hypothetical protein n=1 Tax=Burkholderia pseudomallei TaxID=28450 RepID=UPI0015567744|nr:hypothetical protein [Burkholderia pseudomallei]